MSEDKKPKELLVEGKDDEHVASHIWKHYHNDWPPFGIIVKEGFPNLLKSISSELKFRERETLGILVDANDDLEGRWEAIISRVQEVVSVNSSERPNKSGTIICDKPKVGIWLMPNNSSTGELENFIHELIPCGDRTWDQAVNFIESIRPDDRKFRPHKELRAQIHAWLATRKKPRPMGAAIGASDLNAKAPLAQAFNEWLTRLFD